MSLKLNTVTLVCLDTRNVEAAIDSMSRSLSKVTFAENILFTSKTTCTKELKFKVNIKSINAEMLKSSDELFATSTAGGVMPITKVDGKLIDLGKVGNITRKIHKIYWDKHTDNN